MQYRWIDIETKKIFLIQNDIIYQGNLIKNDLKEIIDVPENDDINSFKSLPISYIKSVSLIHENKHIIINYSKKSTFELNINSPEIRTELFNTLKILLPKANYSKTTLGIFDLAKKPIIGMIVLLICYFTSLISNPITFEKRAKIRINILESIFYALNSLGTLKLTIIFGSLISLTIISIYFKTRIKKIEEKLYFEDTL